MMRIRLASLGFMVLASSGAGFVAQAGPFSIVLGNGVFSNPSPGKDPSNPYYANAPQHVLSWDETSIAWGRPLAPGDVILVNQDGYAYADTSGDHIATNLDGSPWQPQEPLLTQFEVPKFVSSYGSSMRFVPTSWSLFDEPPSLTEPFVIGQIHYKNGITARQTDITSVDLTLSTEDWWAGPKSSSLTVSIQIVNTPNFLRNTPEANADYIFFPQYPEFGTFRVFEGGEAYVDVVAQLGSLYLRGFGSVSGDGFTGSLPPVTPPDAVPDGGGVVWVAGLFLGGVGLFRRLRFWNPQS